MPIYIFGKFVCDVRFITVNHIKMHKIKNGKFSLILYPFPLKDYKLPGQIIFKPSKLL